MKQQNGQESKEAFHAGLSLGQKRKEGLVLQKGKKVASVGPVMRSKRKRAGGARTVGKERKKWPAGLAVVT